MNQDTSATTLDTDLQHATQGGPSISLWSLFITFLKIGSVAFGGFMALISVIENVIVKQRRLIEHKEMLDGISLANLLPGPQAVNVVAFVGYRLRGPLGALVSSTAVILPSFVLLLILSFLYFRYGEVAQVQKVFQGFIPAVAAIVLSVAWRMGKKTVNGASELALVIAAAAITLAMPLAYKVYVAPAIILGFGVLGYLLYKETTPATADAPPQRTFSAARFTLVLALLGALVVAWFLPLPLEPDSLLLLTLTFASMSLMLFGGGYVFIPIIGSIVVLQYGWVTQQEFTDGIAMGQITPGPILISATFIGYKVQGLWGALLATIAIFAPPAVLMVTASHALSFIQGSRVMRAAMHAIHCGVIGLIAVAAWVLLQAAIPLMPFQPGEAWPGIVIFLIALFALLRLRLDVIWIIPPAGLLGYLLY